MRSETNARRLVRVRAAAWLAVATLCGAIGTTLAHAQTTAFSMNGQGELKRPTGYREWVFVGAPVTPDDLNNEKAPFPEFHSVYIDRASWAHWKKTGQFRDGTILVKELLSVGSKQAASGNGYFMGEFIGLEATIKSAKRFPKEPGNWAYFSFTNSDHKSLKPTAAAQATATCNVCHQANATHDWVFIQYYPVLRATPRRR